MVRSSVCVLVLLWAGCAGILGGEARNDWIVQCMDENNESEAECARRFDDPDPPGSSAAERAEARIADAPRMVEQREMATVGEIEVKERMGDQFVRLLGMSVPIQDHADRLLLKVRIYAAIGAQSVTFQLASDGESRRYSGCHTLGFRTDTQWPVSKDRQKLGSDGWWLKPKTRHEGNAAESRAYEYVRAELPLRVLDHLATAPVAGGQVCNDGWSFTAEQQRQIARFRAMVSPPAVEPAVAPVDPVVEPPTRDEPESPKVSKPTQPPPPIQKPRALSCCKVCRDSKACGDSCISATKTCHEPPGCACDG